MIRLATVSPCYNEEAVLHHSVEQQTVLFERYAVDIFFSGRFCFFYTKRFLGLRIIRYLCRVF